MKQKLTLLSWRKEKNYGNYSADKLKLVSNCSTCIILHKSQKSIIRNQNQEHKKKFKLRKIK